MALRAFKSTNFYASAVFSPPAVTDAGDPYADASSGAGAGVTLLSYPEGDHAWGKDSEVGGQPTTRKQWNVFTATDPAARNGWLVAVSGRTLRVKGSSSEEARGAGVLWRTECEEVT